MTVQDEDFCSADLYLAVCTSIFLITVEGKALKLTLSYALPTEFEHILVKSSLTIRARDQFSA